MKEEAPSCEFCEKAGIWKKTYVSMFKEELGSVYFCSKHEREAIHKYNCLYGTGVSRTTLNN